MHNHEHEHERRIPDLSNEPHVPDDFDITNINEGYVGLAGTAMIGSIANAVRLLPVDLEDVDHFITEFIGDENINDDIDDSIKGVLFDGVQEVFKRRYPWALELPELMPDRDSDPMSQESASWTKWKHFSLLEIEALDKFHAKHGSYVPVEVITQEELDFITAKVVAARDEVNARTETLVNMLRNMGIDTTEIEAAMKASKGE